MKETIYALYVGDTFIDVGTAKEIAERQGITPKTVQYLSTPAYLRKLETRKKTSNKGYQIVIKLDMEDEEDESNLY